MWADLEVGLGMGVIFRIMIYQITNIIRIKMILNALNWTFEKVLSQ